MSSTQAMKKIFFFVLILLGGGALSAQVFLTGIARHYSDSVFFISEQGGFSPRHPAMA
jgi:uncharacterized protein with ACT and thioredoxin-like domain